MNESSPLTLQGLALFATIAATVFGIVFQTARWGLDFLTLKFGKSVPPIQAVQCLRDHSDINRLVNAQNMNIQLMLEQNGKLIDALSTANHNASLRHEITLARIEMLKQRVEDIHHKVAQ